METNPFIHTNNILYFVTVWSWTTYGHRPGLTCSSPDCTTAYLLYAFGHTYCIISNVSEEDRNIPKKDARRFNLRVLHMIDSVQV